MDKGGSFRRLVLGLGLWHGREGLSATKHMADEEGADMKKIVNWCRRESSAKNAKVWWWDCHFVCITLNG